MSYMVFQQPESRRLNHHETPIFRQASTLAFSLRIYSEAFLIGSATYQNICGGTMVVGGLIHNFCPTDKV